MEQLPIGAGPDLVNNGGLKVKEKRTRYKFASSSLREESSKIVIFRMVQRHLSIRGDAMLKAEELPTGIANLNASLSNMQIDDLSHCLISVVI